jgi:hypothetical protein
MTRPTVQASMMTQKFLNIGVSIIGWFATTPFKSKTDQNE